MDEASKTRTDVAALFRKGDGLLGKLFANLSPETADQLSAHATLREVPTGTIVLENGQASSEIGHVIDMHVVNGSGRQSLEMAYCWPSRADRHLWPLA